MLRRCNTRRNRGLPAADLRLSPQSPVPSAARPSGTSPCGARPSGSCSGPLQSGAFLTSGPYWDRSRRCAALGAESMAMLSAAASPFCRPIAPEGAFCKPEEDPFLLLESSLKAIERILLLRRGLPLRRTWIEQP